MPEFSSVHTGDDHSFLLEAIPFYLRRRPVTTLRILDATWGKGVFWQGARPAGWRVVGMDALRFKHPEVWADNRQMPFRPQVFDAVVYDPPHVTHPWSAWDQSGAYEFAQGRGSIAYLYPDFLIEAGRVLVPDGIVIAKLADQIHTGKYWWQTFKFIQEAQVAGFTPCDVVIKVRSNYRPQPNGRRQLHARRRHSFYIILRKGRC